MRLAVTRRFHFVVDGDLLAVARVLRLLRRHRAVVERAPWDGEATAMTRVEGRVPRGRHARSLGESLAIDPAVRFAFVEGMVEPMPAAWAEPSPGFAPGD